VIRRTVGRQLPAHTALIAKLHLIMKTIALKSLVVLVVAVATVRSYATLATQTRILPQHLA
jgi:hypothetical protein